MAAKVDPFDKATRGFRVRINRSEAENWPDLAAFADEAVHLKYPGAGIDPEVSNRHSFDIELTTCAGQVLRLERKQGASDIFGSFEKLPRQLGPCHGLILEGIPSRRALQLTGRFADPKFEHLYQSTRKRLWRLSFSVAILPTEDVHDTIRLLAYLGGKTEPIALR